MESPNDGQNLDLEKYREYLALLARMQVDRRWQGKVDLSGVVQQTLFEAHASREQCRGQTDAEKAGWLRKILAHNLADAIRKLRRQKHDMAREQSLEAALGESSSHLEAWAATNLTSPSQHAIRNEQIRRLTQALGQLPESQREVVVLHYLQKQSLEAVAEQVGKSKLAVVGLVHRGVKKLRELMAEAGEDKS